ncbi:feruloyl esterase-like protein [Trametes polyzona]|nr:feruloyl esterase-like protein [Trametes polyzona]
MLSLSALTLALLGSLHFYGNHALSEPVPRDQPSRSSDCLQYSPADLPGVIVSARTYYPANTTVVIFNDYIGMGSSSLPAFCRLQLLITTNETADSVANAELWLPDEWNGRMLTVGGGGLSGGPDVYALSNQALPQGFAGLASNGGHNSSSSDGTWGGPHNDNALVDFAWRAVHLSVQAGKEIVKKYYDHSPKSYYLGCSTGLKEIQLFPDSFDGAVVGSPANWFSRLVTWALYLNQLVSPATSPRFIPEEKWVDVIAPEVMRQCDDLDGVTDGVINDPSVCRFQFEKLSCPHGEDHPTCLNAEQLDTLHQVYADYRVGDTYVFGGYNFGGEDSYFPVYMNTTTPLSGGPVAWFQYMVLNDTNWTPDQFNSSLFRIADEVDPGRANAIDPDLLAFAAPPRNGKILHYVGLTDEMISPRNSFHYYDTVREHVRRYGKGIDIDDFYRLFPAPGMNHCFNGHGANAFGAVFQPPPLKNDAEHNILTAMIRWVEEGVAPTKIIAAKYNNDTAADGVAFTRPLCKHPLKIRYRGGDPYVESSFECV